MEISHFKASRALQTAMQRRITIIQPFDWQILYTLYELKKACGMTILVEYHSANYYKGFSSRYYHATGRLVKAGYVRLTLTKSGFRRWQITTKGQMALVMLNQAAERILNPETGQVTG